MKCVLKKFNLPKHKTQICCIMTTEKKKIEIPPPPGYSLAVWGWYGVTFALSMYLKLSSVMPFDEPYKGWVAASVLICAFYEVGPVSIFVVLHALLKLYKKHRFRKSWLAPNSGVPEFRSVKT